MLKLRRRTESPMDIHTTSVVKTATSNSNSSADSRQRRWWFLPLLSVINISSGTSGAGRTTKKRLCFWGSCLTILAFAFSIHGGKCLKVWNLVFPLIITIDGNGSSGSVDGVYMSVFGEIDDLREGKSCILSPSKRWICRDCGLATNDSTAILSKDDVIEPTANAGFNLSSTSERTLTTQKYFQYESYSKCPILKHRGKCPHFKSQGWDEPNHLRSASTYQSNFITGTVRTLGRVGLVGRRNHEQYIQAQCSLTSTATSTVPSTCFNLDKCRRRKIDEKTSSSWSSSSQPLNGSQSILDMKLPMKVFPAGSYTKEMMERIISRLSLQKKLEITMDPKEACLFYAAHSEDTKKAMESSHWNHGQNHIVHQRETMDQPFNLMQFEQAALLSTTMTDAHLRSDYDLAWPLEVKWQPPPSEEAKGALLDLHRPRKYLLSFRGSVSKSLPPYQQHRWLAGEYWWGETDVAIDVQCYTKNIWGEYHTTHEFDAKGSSSGKNVDNDDSHFKEMYSDYLMNSTFGFCPGGTGVGSFRFGEVLKAGGIPVLIPGTVPPLHPEIDWSQCVVTVSEARIVDLPRLLRGISPEKVRDRQKECQRLYKSIIEDADRKSAATLLIWAERIHRAIQFKSGIEETKNLFFANH